MAAFKKPLIIGIVLVIAAVAGFFVYLDKAFPKVRCEAANVKHLTAPEELGDCYSCHAKVTPVVAQDWKDSKHGVLLVKCFVCHGQPDGKGAIPFAVKPSYNDICARCHEPSMNKMKEKFGQVQDCETCHPRHQNPMHRGAFEAVTATDKTNF